MRPSPILTECSSSSFAILVQVTTVQQLCRAQEKVFHMAPLHPPPLTSFPLHLPRCSPNTGGCGTDKPGEKFVGGGGKPMSLYPTQRTTPAVPTLSLLRFILSR